MTRRASREPGPSGRGTFSIVLSTLVIAVGSALNAPPVQAQQPDLPLDSVVFSMDPAQSAGFLRTGDMLHIQVWRQPELSGEFFVNEEGVIAHPLYNTIRVANRPVEEVPSLIWQFLTRFDQEPNFEVEPFFQVFVGGEVREPNLLFLRPGSTIAQAVVQAGGATNEGDLGRVRVRRDGQEYEVDLTDPRARQSEFTIRSRDEITVEENFSFWSDLLQPALSVGGSLAWIYILISGR
jgi:protein involved in polysaccharide export with SLBB domain